MKVSVGGSFLTVPLQMPDAINYSHRSPVGVSTLITPWNLPIYLFTWKVAPALACGNTVRYFLPATWCAAVSILTLNQGSILSYHHRDTPTGCLQAI